MRWRKGNDDEDGASDAPPSNAQTVDDQRGAPSPDEDGATAAPSPVVSPWGDDESGPASFDPPDVPIDLIELDPAAVERAVRRAAARALAEDLGEGGDVTAAATVPAGTTGTAHIVARADGVVSGTDVIAGVFEQIDGRLQLELEVADGDRVESGQVLATIRGPLRSILTGERSALNLLGHLSGIATRTRAFVEAVEGTGVAIRDTRKTTAGLRILEKRAVRDGGGHNHRLGLSDALLVKENHIAAAGSLTAAVEGALSRAEGRHVQVEVTTLSELEEALRAGVTDILLDNMTPEEARQAVARTRGRASLEASGGIDLATARSYATTGVQRLAIGSLTHSAPWLDVALDVVTEQLERPEWRLDEVWREPDESSDGTIPTGSRTPNEVENPPPPAPKTSGVESQDDPPGAGLFAWRERQSSD